MTEQLNEIEEWQEFTEDTIEALLEDGSQPDADYTIEYHLAAKDFDKLEKAAVETFKLGFEVTDAEELELDDGGRIFSFDAVIERKLDAEAIDKDVEQLIKLANKFDIFFDGWGTYFIE